MRGCEFPEGLCFGELYCVMTRLGFYRKAAREGAASTHETAWRLLRGVEGGVGRGERVSVRLLKAFCCALMGVSHGGDEK